MNPEPTKVNKQQQPSRYGVRVTVSGVAFTTMTCFAIWGIGACSLDPGCDSSEDCDPLTGSSRSRIRSAVSVDGATAILGDTDAEFVALVRSESVAMLGGDGLRIDFDDGTTISMADHGSGYDYVFRNQRNGMTSTLQFLGGQGFRTKQQALKTELGDCSRLGFEEEFFGCVATAFREMAAGHLENIANNLQEAASDASSVLGAIRERGVDLATNWTQNVVDFISDGEVNTVDIFVRAVDRNDALQGLLDDYRAGPNSSPYEFTSDSSPGTLRSSSLREAVGNSLSGTNDSTITNPTSVTIDDVFCNPGTVFDLPSGTCVTRNVRDCVPIVCNAGFVFDSVLCDCVVDPLASCPPSFSFNSSSGDCRNGDGCTTTKPFPQPDGTCRETANGGCPPGSSRLSDGECRTPDGCPGDLPFLVGGFCFSTPNPCPPGTSVSSDGQCRTPDGCPASLPFAVNGLCFATPSPCPPGTAVSSNDGSCRTAEGCLADFPFLWSDGLCHSSPETSSGACGDGVCDSSSGELTNCPQDCPANCGDGFCNASAGEQQSCPQDCPQNDCCVQTNGCPSEELFSCPGDCCCCASGARCIRPRGVWICGV